jgi:hypothetical protein
MTTQQRRAVGIGPPISPVLEGQPTDRHAGTEEPAWLWDSLRFRFWEPTDLARGMRHAGGLEPEQREVAASWWSLLAAADQLGPRMYAAAFVRATEQHQSDQVRWSLLAMLRDELQHEQLFRLGMQYLAPGWPLGAGPRTAPGRHAEQHLRQVNQEAERCWHGYHKALDRHGVAVVTGGLLLGALATGGLYDRCASGCVIPAFATAFRHLSHDAKRHQGALRALMAMDWPRLSALQRAEAAAQVQATAGFLTSVMLDPATRAPGVSTPDDLAITRAVACWAGLGIPSGEQCLEVLRAALLNVKDLQGLYGVPFPAMPTLAIPGTERAISDDYEGRERYARL